MNQVHIRARLVNRNHEELILPECTLAVGEVRVDRRTDTDVEIVDIENDIAICLPIRGMNRDLYEVTCAEATGWQCLGSIEDFLVA